MALSLEEVRKIAALARLSLSPEEETLYAGQLSEILEYVRLLEELDVSSVVTMTHALGDGESASLREDVPLPSLAPEIATENAPASEAGLFRVPRIIE